ncbi:hypothetical protein GOP47_0006176 [Adiantum capillus-veneris]|uniref:Protein JASON n=1 Tax=Adiantum capillus-veneris TaxID=13818 RepID=A0A9D4ZMS8_ADICA|nr:hypothetical protein GOP47_0006176 [Adiantum capillus-veneris]
MGWLLGCFKCTGKPEGVKPKKQLSGVNNLVSGRSNSAAVAHATSPEDLHVVRKLPSAASSKGCIDNEPNDTLFALLQEQAKTKKSAKNVSKQDEDRVWSHEYDLDGELESFRERLLQDATVAKQCSDEVKFLRGCHSLIDSPSNAFKVTFDKSDQGSTEQVDYTQHSWLVSSLVTRIQPGGLVTDSCSRPSSPLPNACEASSLHSRGKTASQSNSFDSFADSNAIKCTELSLFRVESGVCDAFADGIHESMLTTENKPHCRTNSRLPKRYVPSPPWTFSMGMANEKCSSVDEAADDLLLEHLDVASLIEDSALITNWELSSGSPGLDKLGLNDQPLLRVPSEEQRESLVISLSSEQAIQEHLEGRTDECTLDFDSIDRTPSVPEACTENQPGSCKNPFLDEASCCSNGIPSELVVPHDSKETHVQAESCAAVEAYFSAAAEESDSDSTSQNCFASQFRLSKRVWSSAKKNPAEKESNTGDYFQHKYTKDAHEVLLLSMCPEMEPLQESKSWEDEHCPLLSAASESSVTPSDNRVGHWDGTDLHGNNNISYLEAELPQDNAEDFLTKDKTDLMKNGNPSFVPLPVEEEDGEQRKKLKIGHDGLSGGMQEGKVVEDDDDKVPLLDAQAIEVDYQSSVDARVECASKHESTVSMHVMEESAFREIFPTLPLSPDVGIPPVTSYRSPASLADERPILGTVAAHWSPITTRKWWDGKGIPNSTNKYQEDQKVNWHAIPFEVRLEQALAKQDTVLSK